MAENKNEINEQQYASIVYEQGGSLMVDMAAVQEAKFENIPKGIYDAEVDEFTFGMSQSSGAPMNTGVFRITSGEYEGRKLWCFFSYSRKALPFTKANIARLAPELANTAYDPKALAEQGQPINLLGRKCQIRVTIGEDQQGNDRSQISNILPPKEGAGNGAASGGGYFGQPQQ